MNDNDLVRVMADEYVKALSRYTVGPENLERVIGLVTDDMLEALRPMVEKSVRESYEAIFKLSV